METLPTTPDSVPATDPAPRLAARDARVSAARLRRAIAEVNSVHTPAQPSGDWSGALAWALDPEPVVLDAPTWSTIEAAVQQRARTINAFLADLYTHQNVLRQRIVPPEMVLGDPFFRRACVGLEPTRASPATLLRFDLVKTAAGGWMFVESFANTTVGASFAVQNRRFLTQERGDLFAALPEFRVVTDFPLRLLEHLKRLSLRDTDNPTIVLLTTGPEDPNYFEHSFLARKMGLPLAQGADLLVLEERVFFKTIAGLVPVDVIYRRMNDRHVDPVVFNTDRLIGVPGLVSSIRARRVAVANAIGAGVADNRALEAYLPRLTRYYFGERTLLPGVPSYYCGDVDQLAVVHDDTDGALALLPTQPSHHAFPSALPGCAAEQRRLALRELAQHPHGYVARVWPQVAAGSAPNLGPGARETRLSCFALCDGRDVEVMPGGLCR
ncbi:MAG: circularly permuted type 2 ATP-grasp protein, partial [Opitutaceae bacterium]|nr:circularly permuted type 2 ATP-grasp protein [Opitutaceae bacterium]